MESCADTPKPKDPRGVGPKRTPFQRERDLPEIADKLLMEWTQKQIADWLSGSRPYTLTRQTISKDIAESRRRYLENEQEHVAALLKKDLRKLARIESKAWGCFERSEGEKVKTEAMTGTESGGQEKKAKGGRVKVTKENQCGERAYLAEIRECIIVRARMLGFFKAEKIELTGADGQAVKVETKSDLSKLSVPELEALEALLEKATLKA